jgi:hypothetical protein
VTVQYWPRSSLWLLQAAPGGNCRRSSAPPDRPFTGVSRTDPQRGCGPSCTAWCWTGSVRSVSWTGRAARSTQSAFVRSKGALDWTEPD